MKVLDLCSGLGGFSEAWMSNHEVTRIENNPLLEDVANTTIICIHEFAKTVKKNQFDVILASPPCLEFSLAYNAPRATNYRADKPHTPSMAILESCIKIIDIVQPKHWIIENVAGSERYFSPYLGKPNFVSQPFLFYGVFPHLGTLPKHTKKSVDKRHDPLRANIRAKIPFEISHKIMSAIVNQKSLFDYRFTE